jgi:hypothetical protein
MPLAAWSRTLSWLANEKAHSRARTENAGGRLAEDTKDEEESDMGDEEKRRSEKELSKNNRN